MPYVDFIWTHAALVKIDLNDVSVAEAEQVVREARGFDTSRSSSKTMALGFTPTGRRIAVVFEWFDRVTVIPVTAFEAD